MALAYIALGSNLGDRLATLRAAVAEIAAFGAVLAWSSVYETAPVGYAEQPPYLNAVVALETELTPLALLAGLHEIERRHGRVRSFLNAPRTLDLDILLYDDRMVDESDVTIPHPRMHERGFVLVPLTEIAPDTVVPGRGETVASLLNGLGPVAGISLAHPATMLEASSGERDRTGAGAQAYDERAKTTHDGDPRGGSG